jgi:hypothetical protein
MPDRPVIKLEPFGRIGRGVQEFVVLGYDRLRVCKYNNFGISR